MIMSMPMMLKHAPQPNAMQKLKHSPVASNHIPCSPLIPACVFPVLIAASEWPRREALRNINVVVLIIHTFILHKNELILALTLLDIAKKL